MPVQLEAVRFPPSPATIPPAGDRSFLRTIAPPALVILAALAVSAPTITFDFVLYDDDYLVYANPVIRDLGNIVRFFDPGADRSQMGSEYLPMTTLSFALDYALYGNDPHGFHATGVLLYALCCWLLFSVLTRLTPNRWAAAAGAILFAVHPVHTENFAWVAGRKSLLNGVFVLVSLLAYINFRTRGDQFRWYCLSLVCYVLAFFSKYTAVSLPGAFLAYDLLCRKWEGEGWSRARLFAASRNLTVTLLPFLILGAMLSVFAVEIGVRYETVTPRPDALWSSAVNDPILLLYYLKLLLFPVDQCAYYLWPIRGSMTPPAVMGYATASALLVTAWVSRGRAPLVSFAVLWFFALLVPVLNFFPKIPQLAERYIFLSSVALSLVVVWAFERAGIMVADSPRVRRAAVAIFAAIIVVFGFASHLRSSVWRDSFKLWDETLRHPMASPTAYDQLGLAHLKLRRDPRAAIKVFEAGLESMVRRGTTHSRLAADLRFHLVLSHLKGRQVDQARRHWRQLERTCSESGDATLGERFQTWQRDLRDHYPELFTRRASEEPRR